MQAILPIAGKSSRMAKKYQGPKQLLQVAGKPLIEHMLESIPSAIDELVLIVGGPYEKEIREYFGDNHSGRKISYAKQSEPLGLGHAVQQAKGIVKGKFLVVLPDDFLGASDLQKMIEQPDLAALAFRRHDPQNFGVFVCDDQGKIIKTLEKPKEFVSDLVSVGCYLLDEEFFDVTVPPSARGEIELPDIINALIIERHRTVQVIEASVWFPVNDPEQLDLASELLKARKLGEVIK